MSPLTAKLVKRIVPGDIVLIPLDKGATCCAQVLVRGGLIVFNKAWKKPPESLEEVTGYDIVVHVVVESSVYKGRWPWIGHAPIPPDLVDPKYWKPSTRGRHLVDLIVGGNIVNDIPREQAIGLPRHRIWLCEAIEERLKHHFNGTKDPWDERMGPLISWLK